MAQKKKFQDLEFSDAFMFAATMEDEEICRQVLERILEIPIKKVKVRSESLIAYNPDYRSIRLDVYADDADGTMYDVEMENARKRKQLPKRGRLYQSEMDVAVMKPGDAFECLPRSYVIFICTFDPFHSGLFRYTFENRCLENGRSLGDESYKIYLNTKGKITDGVPGELIRFLTFVENSAVIDSTADPLLDRLQARIQTLKRDRGMERSYMRISDMISDERREAREEGREEGLAEGLAAGVTESNQSWLALLAVIQPEDLAELQKTPQSVERMFEKYQIK